MCIQLHLAIPEAGSSVVDQFRTKRFKVYPCNSLELLQLLPPNYLDYHVTDGWCSCSFGMPPEGWRAEHSIQKRAEDLRHRYEKKGWSASKIDHALRDSVKAWSREKPHEISHREQITELEQYLSELAYQFPGEVYLYFQGEHELCKGTHPILESPLTKRRWSRGTMRQVRLAEL